MSTHLLREVVVLGFSSPFIFRSHYGYLGNVRPLPQCALPSFGTTSILLFHWAAEPLPIRSIELGEGKKVVVQSFKDLVSVKTVSASYEEYAGSHGILGDYETGKLLSCNGTVMQDANAFGNEWQVLDTEPKLFQTTLFPQFPRKCTMPKVEEMEARRLAESTIPMEAAEKA